MITVKKTLWMLAICLSAPALWTSLVGATPQEEETATAAVLSPTAPASLSDEQDDQQEERLDREQEKRDRAQEARDREQEKREHIDELYDQATEALDQSHWDKAIEDFTRVAEANGGRADGALYWKAYAQNKLGRRADSLASLRQLEKTYPHSRWINDAKALEVEVRQASGRPASPESEANDDLKLLAINSLMNTDIDRALPMLEKFLQGNQPPKLKERALFVLAQSGSPRARQVLADAARGKSNPDLQVKALQYLALFGGKESRQVLAEIYASSNDTDVKRSILHGFMISGERERLLNAAKSEKNPELRMDAIHQLGVMGAGDELWQLYQTEPSAEVKEAILHSLFIGGKPDKLEEVARNEKDANLRRAAIHSLGLMGGDRAGTFLTSLYKTEKDPSLRGEILSSLFIQGNAKALIEVARTENNPELKRAAIKKLSLMHSKEATDYMMELLNK